MNIALRICTNLQNILTHRSPIKTLNARAARSQHSVANETEPSPSAFVIAALFVRRNYFRIFAISALVLVPCLWHTRIAAGDLASHMYNAWLAQLIERGQVTGLWLDTRWNNVLFDLLVSGLGKLFSLQVTEKIAASACVLIFFWGAFALVSASSKKAPWFLVPLFAMITYGYTFHMGFFNYYLSLGLAFFGIAIFWRGKKWERLIPLALAPLILLAHPLGLAWMAGAIAYIAIAEAIPAQHQPWLLLVAGIGLVLIHFDFWRHYEIMVQPDTFYFFNGADQLLLFGPRYNIPRIALICFTVAALVVDIYARIHERGDLRKYAIAAELYVLLILAAWLLPDAIRFRPGNSAVLALLTERLTSVSAVVFCCVLGAMRPRWRHLIGFTAIAAVFFTFVYQDTKIVNQLEQQAAQLERTLPRDSRVLATIRPPQPGSRVSIQHIADRACIGYCFSYGNYEPSSEFRVRALPGNPYVMSDYDLVVDMEDGTYEVQPEDLPAYQLFQCSPSGTELCIRPLVAGEENDRLGVHPDE
jgi:hypothetical protein